MAETQANKLRARTRDALGPKVRQPLCCVCAEVAETQVLQCSLVLLSSTRNDRHTTPGSEEEYPV